MTYSEHVPGTLLPIAAGLSVTLMLVFWLWYRRLGNAGLVDVGWALGLTGVSLLYAATGIGDSRRKWLMAAMVTLWGTRLALYLLRDRIVARSEDPRYADLRQRGSVAARMDFLPFFVVQALLVVVLSVPMLIAAVNPAPAWTGLELAAALLWLTAFVGESIADRQLERFKATRSRHGGTCRDGLWRYSRHPNYFFEWLIWVAYALYALDSPGGPLALTAPALMLYLLFRVTGIPATEAQALRTKGDDYRRYQQTTSVFVPWPPRETS